MIALSEWELIEMESHFDNCAVGIVRAEKNGVVFVGSGWYIDGVLTRVDPESIEVVPEVESVEQILEEIDDEMP